MSEKTYTIPEFESHGDGTFTVRNKEVSREEFKVWLGEQPFDPIANQMALIDLAERVTALEEGKKR